jgi:hypothetical protein
MNAESRHSAGSRAPADSVPGRHDDSDLIELAAGAVAQAAEALDYDRDVTGAREWMAAADDSLGRLLRRRASSDERSPR